MNFLKQDVQFLPSVGPKKADLLRKELDIYTVEDFLRYYPYKYVDRSQFYDLSEITEDSSFVQVKGQITRFEKLGVGQKQRLVAIFTDGKHSIELIWFKSIKYIVEKYKLHTEYILFGKPSVFNGKLNITHPELELAIKLPPPEQMGLQPFYNTSEKMKSHFLHSKALQKIMLFVVQQIKTDIPEILPNAIIKKFSLCNLTESLINIHFPKNIALLNKARQRLKFEELFYIQLGILQFKNRREQQWQGFVFKKIGYYFNTFFNTYLPYQLTTAQKRVLREIRVDVASGRHMNRLLQGDVGSGKTLVALMTMLMAVDNGFQACMVAPTEILATQHIDTLTKLLGNIGIEVGLLTGSTKVSERKILHEKLRNGTLSILIGTHALMEDTVQFSNLGLVVIDEQHRFGVAQRAKLWKKNDNPPHVLVMTATPIPRTLAMTLYGDLSVSVIDELPPGRKPIQTYHYYQTKRMILNNFIRKQVESGRQIYVVYPLIQESEAMDLQNLEEGHNYFCENFPAYKCSVVHGKMKSPDKDKQMQKFVQGETQIMLATTVIEVGVHVPNASVMIIESAERFGLSQLHQLRGRVGRGAEQSYCVLLTGIKLTSDTRKRIDIMVRTNDGFEIAEADLRLRGPGDMEGIQQSGLPFDLKIADLAKDGKMLEIARAEAIKILNEDPQLAQAENSIMLKQLSDIKKNKVYWGAIS